MVKLNLGCCDNIIPGYINIDSRPIDGKDIVVMDLEKGIDY